MNQDQLLGLVRNLVSLGGGFAIGRGYLTGEQVTLVGGIVGAVAPVLWSYFAHTDAAKLSAAAALPDVKKIVTVASPVSAGVASVAQDPEQTKITNGG